MKRRIIISLLSLCLLFSTGAIIATVYIKNTTAKFDQLMKLHQIQDFRTYLVMSVQTAQSDLYTVRTPLAKDLDSIVSHVMDVERAAQTCTNCHHSPDMAAKLDELQSLVRDYQNALSQYMTASANVERVDRLKFDAAAVGNKLLGTIEAMSSDASKKLEAMTSSAMSRIAKVKTVLYATILMTFIFGVIIAARLTLSITRPVNELLKATRVIASGDIGHTIDFKDRTEFGELAHNFNQMSVSLKTGYEKLREEIAERKETEQALVKSEKFLSTIFDSVHDPFCIIDSRYTIVRANDGYAALKGKAVSDLIGKVCYEVLEGRTKVCDNCVVDKTLRSSDPAAKEKKVLAPGGRKTWLEIYTYPIFSAEGNVSHVIEYTRDITGRKLAEEALKESKERYELAARGSNDGLWDWNLKTGQVYYSPRWKSMVGHEERDMGDSPEAWFNLVHSDDRKQLEAQIASHIDGHTSHLESQFRILHRDGTYRWVLNRGLAVRDESGEAHRMAGSITDITEQKVTEQQLLHDAFHDALTDLPNRALFLDRLQHVIKISKRRRNYLYAVLFLDMDRFKVINDSLGHMTGDELLVAVSGRLVKCLRPGDTVARLGGDEFAILLDDIKDMDEVSLITDRIQSALAPAFLIGGKELFATASIGVAVGTTGYEMPEHLLRDADIAMYQAKARGKARSEVFDVTMYASILSRLQLETDLRSAVEHKAFRMHYQPIMNLKAGKVIGFEALVRWQHPKRGLVYPLEFIPVAEETGLIFALGQWVLEESCRQIKAWQDRYPVDPPLKLSVNISSKQLSQSDLVTKVAGILKEVGLEPSCLALEITESMIMENKESAIALMNELRDLGVHIHIDDFGTGYSSLSYIHNFPVNALKIDRSFVAKMSSSDENLEIIKTIVALAHNLNLDLIAEGMELSDQWALLKDLKCQHGQGFLFSHPLEADGVDAWMGTQTIA
jgi:diguanylate cyclase (GGDEF)-like protein/PAS domain S-box-containing protein